jgi:hypothetical protein
VFDYFFWLRSYIAHPIYLLQKKRKKKKKRKTQQLKRKKNPLCDQTRGLGGVFSLTLRITLIAEVEIGDKWFWKLNFSCSQ